MVQATLREYIIERDIDLIWRMRGRVRKTSEEMFELLCEGEAEEAKKEWEIGWENRLLSKEKFAIE